MAFKKTMIQRLFTIARTPNPSPSLKPPLRQFFIPPDPANRSVDPEPGDGSGLLRRIVQSKPGLFRSIPTGHDQLIEKLKLLDASRDRIRLEGLVPPFKKSPESEKLTLTVKDINKLLRASQLELIKQNLKKIHRDWVSYSEFVELCTDGCNGDKERGAVIAKVLDDSGSVIVVGNAVCLHPVQVAKAIQGLIPLPLNPNDPRRKELETLEKQKREIDMEAESQVRRELWLGLGYMIAQTAAFARLTFWELSWDVMEPICFYVTSAYFMAGYTFFLRTSKEPSFEGFFQSRFEAKQKKLIETRGFDIHRYNYLRRGHLVHDTPLINTTSFAS